MSETKTDKFIKSVRVIRTPDDCSDLSHLGEYSDRPGADDVTIDRAERGDQGLYEYRYFIATMSAKDTGNPHSVEQDYERMESHNRGDWGMISIRAQAKIIVNGTCQTVRSGGLGGIESDSGDHYFSEVGGGELAELGVTLVELGFSEEEVADAFAEVDASGEYE